MTTHRIDLEADTHEKVTLLSRAWEVTPGQAVARLVDHFHNAAASPVSPPAAPEDDTVPVHAFYRGKRVTGRYDLNNRSLTVDPGPGEGHYKSPSGAAVAVLRDLKPDGTANRNGWSFWLIDSNGETLQSIREQY
ncbi:DUF4357 domain-containing protein [Streptomyces sp. NPDC005438]|uniref:DUF4357 domain-containing protein n=1 Tax=Streptomyces sp. NPDC005438 TaxID=3156880 RepID=UPI00339F2163